MATEAVVVVVSGIIVFCVVAVPNRALGARGCEEACCFILGVLNYSHWPCRRGGPRARSFKTDDHYYKYSECIWNTKKLLALISKLLKPFKTISTC